MFTFRKIPVPHIYLDDFNLFLMNNKKNNSLKIRKLKTINAER